MAGIGWRLERLIHRGVSGAAAAYATGAAVMALPWMLTTVVLVSIPLAIRGAAVELGGTELVVNVAYGVALIVAGPVQIVLSRYASDRLYEGRTRAIGAPFCRGLAATFALCALPAAGVLLAVHQPFTSAFWGAVLSAAVGAQWTALSVGNGLCSPKIVLGAVGAGSAQSFLVSAFLVAVLGFGISGYLFGLVTGQILTLVILLIGIFRALPDEADERAKLLPAFRDYASLAAAGLAFNASLWVDKLLVGWLVGGETATIHSGASTLAWLSTIPCLAWVFVEVETTFHRSFRGFFQSLEGGAPLSDLRRGVRALAREALRLLGGALTVQAGIAVFLELAADPVARWLRLPAEAVESYRFLLVAAGAQALGLLGLILLYYFDLRREACAAAAGLLATVAACTWAAARYWLLPPSAGTALGCVLGASLIWCFVVISIPTVLEHTLLDQPFGAERKARRKRLRLYRTEGARER